MSRNRNASLTAVVGGCGEWSTEQSEGRSRIHAKAFSSSSAVLVHAGERRSTARGFVDRREGGEVRKKEGLNRSYSCPKIKAFSLVIWQEI